MDIIKQLTVYEKCKEEDRIKERKRLMRLLIVKIFEASMNDEDPSVIFDDLRKKVEALRVKKYNELVRAFGVIKDQLF